MNASNPRRPMRCEGNTGLVCKVASAIVAIAPARTTSWWASGALDAPRGVQTTERGSETAITRKGPDLLSVVESLSTCRHCELYLAVRHPCAGISRGARGARGGTTRGGLLDREEIGATLDSAECRAHRCWGLRGEIRAPDACISRPAFVRGESDADPKNHSAPFCRRSRTSVQDASRGSSPRGCSPRAPRETTGAPSLPRPSNPGTSHRQ